MTDTTQRLNEIDKTIAYYRNQIRLLELEREAVHEAAGKRISAQYNVKVGDILQTTRKKAEKAGKKWFRFKYRVRSIDTYFINLQSSDDTGAGAVVTPDELWTIFKKVE